MWLLVVGGVVVVAALVAFALIGRPLRVAARAAFRPLGLRARRAGLTGVRGRGALHGRTLEVRIARSLDAKSSSIVIELASGSRFDCTFGPREGAPEPLAPHSGDELAAPGFPDCRVTSTDASRTLALCRAAESALTRLLAAPSPAQRRWVLVRAEKLVLVVVGDAWPTTLATDLDELVALAAKAERV